MNPFIPIETRTRIIIAIGLLFWKTIPEIFSLFKFTPISFDYSVLTIIIVLLTDLLLIYPLLKKQIFGTPTGYLHPLLFPVFFSTIIAFIKNPVSIFGPILTYYTKNSGPVNPIFDSFSNDRMASLDLELRVLALIALLSLYFGFSLKQSSKKINWIPLRPPNRLLVYGIIIGILGVSYFLIYQSGGIFQHFASLAFGRFAARDDMGFMLVIMSIVPYLMILIFLLKPSSLKSLHYPLLFMFVCIAIFIASGSRSEVFQIFLMAIAVWAYKSRRLPLFVLMCFAVTSIPLIGITQDIRAGSFGDSNGIELDRNYLGYALERSAQEIENRGALKQNIAVLAFVPENFNHSFGKTYVGALAFFIPRSIWTNKPRAGGADVAALMYYGKSSTKNYQGEGYPIRGETEAFWNFSYPGVIIIFIFFGYIKKYAALYLIGHRNSVNVTLFYFLFLFTLTDFNSDTLVTFFQTTVVLYCVTLLGKLVIVDKGNA